MRQVVYAASFVEDADEISRYISEKFGPDRAAAFNSDLEDFCEAVADSPRLGRARHGYASSLNGVVYGVNWIFFRYDDAEVQFIHIVDSRRDKSAIRF
jgi:plasmid stabilization system protein ParE